MLHLRPFIFPRDMTTLVDITVAAFQFASRPEWSVPDELGTIIAPQLKAMRAIYPLWHALRWVQPTARTALGGFIAEVDGQPIGVANVLRLRESPHFEIGNVGVHPDFRRRGIGRQLIEACLHHAQALGGTIAHLDVISDNIGAVLLYENMGFSTISKSYELTHPSPTPAHPPPHLPAPYRISQFGFGDGYHWAKIGAAVGQSAIVEDYHYLPSLRWIAPAFFAFANMGFWGRAIYDENDQVQAVASILYQLGNNSATLAVINADVLPHVLAHILDASARHNPMASLTLSVRHTSLPRRELLDATEAAGFWLDFQYQRMALPLSGLEFGVQSSAATSHSS